MTNFVQIQSGNFRALIRPENLAKVEDKLAKVKPGYKLPAPRETARTYPTYKPGMSTLEYVRAFEKANNMRYPQHLGMVSPYEHLNAAPATQYDPTVPLCVEDANPDYIAGVDDAPVKVKTPRRDAKAERITALESALKWVTACLINPHGSMDTWAAIENAQKVLK